MKGICSHNNRILIGETLTENFGFCSGFVTLAYKAGIMRIDTQLDSGIGYHFPMRDEIIGVWAGSDQVRYGRFPVNPVALY